MGFEAGEPAYLYCEENAPGECETLRRRVRQGARELRRWEGMQQVSKIFSRDGCHYPYCTDEEAETER